MWWRRIPWTVEADESGRDDFEGGEQLRRKNPGARHDLPDEPDHHERIGTADDGAPAGLLRRRCRQGRYAFGRYGGDNVVHL